jgi:branched-chain amino acid transport system ATP-binding protein
MRRDAGGDHEASAGPLLSVAHVSVRFGGIGALDGVSFDIARGQIVGLIGPNGAGKTTLFNCLSRLYPLAGGDIRFAGRSIAGRRPHGIASLGIGRTFQNLALFRSLSVFDNILAGHHARERTGFLANALRTPGVVREEAAARERALALVRFLGLEPVLDRPAGALPFGTQKRIELGRALASDPALLLLDEPASGLNHEEVAALGGVIREIRDRLGITILLVEHHMNLVMSVSDKVVALDFGRKIAEGPPAEVRNDPAVVRAYLGGAATPAPAESVST